MYSFLVDPFIDDGEARCYDKAANSASVQSISITSALVTGDSAGDCRLQCRDQGLRFMVTTEEEEEECRCSDTRLQHDTDCSGAGDYRLSSTGLGLGPISWTVEASTDSGADTTDYGDVVDSKLIQVSVNSCYRKSCHPMSLSVSKGSFDVAGPVQIFRNPYRIEFIQLRLKNL